MVLVGADVVSVESLQLALAVLANGAQAKDVCEGHPLDAAEVIA